MTDVDPSILRDRLRRETAELLGYDIDNLTAAQSVRLDRAATLRLELDDIETRQLAGLPIEMAKYVVASEALERLVATAHGNPEQTTSGMFAGARAELAALVENLARAEEYKAGAAAAREEAAMAAEALDAPREPPAIEPPPRTRPVLVQPVAEPPPRDIPSHYLKQNQKREPWTDYLDGSAGSRGSRWGPI